MSEVLSLFAPVRPCVDGLGHAWETSTAATPPASSHGPSWAAVLACRRCGERLQFAPVRTDRRKGKA